MAGVKGRSGGKRPGAGRKPKDKSQQALAGGAAPDDKSNSGEAAVDFDPVLGADGLPVKGRREPLAFLEDVLNTPGAPLKDRIRAAIAAAQYKHTKTHDGGKKDAVADRAKKAATGRFAPKAPPKLVVNNR